MYIFRRCLLFAVALFVNAFGIAFITKAALGTSPITSVTYVASMFTPLTMGQWTIVLNLLFVLLELLFMTRSRLRADLRMYLLQIPITLCFGTFIDVSMSLLSWLEPSAYFSKIGDLLIGCFILAVGISLEVKANVAMMAGEYFVRTISWRFRKDFGYMKMGFDITLVVLACTMSLIAMKGIYGVREGTVIAAFIVGPIVHFLMPFYRFMDKWIGDGKYAPAAEAVSKSEHVLITIAREFGSGGHQLGEMLSKELGIKLYDKQFIHLAAQESGMDEAYIRRNEQSIPSFWLKCVMSDNGQHVERSLSPDDVLFVAESRIIQQLAEKESCVIIGRCADFILKDSPRLIRLFCYTDPASAKARCVSEYGVPEDKAEAEIRRVNRNRIAHYEFYTGRRWGDPHCYDLMVNTGTMDMQTVCDTVKALYRKLSR